MNDDLKLVRFLLPGYECTETKIGDIRCVSKRGFLSEKSWEKFFNNIKIWFGERFKEVYHEVNYNHKDFHIYYKAEEKTIDELKKFAENREQ